MSIVYDRHHGTFSTPHWMKVFFWYLLVAPTSFVGAELTVFQAEDGLLTNVSITNDYPGYEGTGYADHNDDQDEEGTIQWSYSAKSSGKVEITLRYSSIDDRPMDLYVDDVAGHEFACNGTGAWGNWGMESVVLNLETGNHVLRLEAPYESPCVDYLSVSSSDDAPPSMSDEQALVSLPTESRSSTVVYQGEAAVSLNKVGISSSVSGYSGKGYANYGGVGGFATWVVKVSTTSRYVIKARYGASTSRKCNLYVNGDRKGSFAFKGLGAWNKWSSESITVSLPRGENRIMIRADESSGPHIDWISVTPDPGSAAFPPSRVILGSNKRMNKGEFIYSPNGEFKAGLTNQGDFVLQRKNGTTIWSAGVANRGFRLFVQPDGNVILRNSNYDVVWTAKTNGNPGAQLVIDDGGRIAIVDGTLAIWFQGIPRGVYTGRPNANLVFPIRGIFYYPWFPQTWTVNGTIVRFVPDLGLYSSSDPAVIAFHIDALEYARTDLIICSWFGPDSNLDRGRITMLMDAMIASGSKMRLAIYYERERDQRPSSTSIKKDLDYLKAWFAWHPAFAHMNNRPVIFVYNRDDCNVAKRWMEASNKEWYVVPKLFPGYRNCTVQPDHWHQYGVGDGNPLSYTGYSTTIAPGFWRADRSKPLLPRLTKTKFCENVQTMIARKEPFQLIVTFNEHGEGTGVEASSHWASDSGYGYYLDCLHEYY